MNLNNKENHILIKDTKDFINLWKSVKKYIIFEIGESNYKRWFERIKIDNFSNDNATIFVNNPIDKFWIESNYSQILSNIFSTKLNYDINFNFIVSKNNLVNEDNLEKSKHIIYKDSKDFQNNLNHRQSKLLDENYKNSNYRQQELVPCESDSYNRDIFKSRDLISDEKHKNEVYYKTSSKSSKIKIRELLKNFNPKYRFSNFICNKDNTFVKNAAESICQNLEININPLFIYSESGIGKTHLVNAIAQELIITRGLKVCYKTGENFTNDYIESIKKGEFKVFRKTYRNCDVLIIDDVQFIAGKDKSMNEFLHTFNTLIDKNKQVILTSDIAPKNMKTLEKKLLTRFQGGLVLKLTVPDFETRLAILEQKCYEWNIFLDNDILNLIAEKVQSSVRCLEGALRRVSSFKTLSKQNVGIDVINRLIQDLTSKPKKSLSIKKIRSFVVKKFKITKNDIISRSRSKSIIIPRQMAMKLCRDLTTKSLNEIGSEFGNKKHSHVIHAINSFEKKLKNSKDLYNSYNSIKSELLSK